MKKTYRIEVDCPTCAEKLEQCAAAESGVDSCSVNPMTQKLVIDAPADQHAEIIEAIARKMKSIDDDVVIYTR